METTEVNEMICAMEGSGFVQSQRGEFDDN